MTGTREREGSFQALVIMGCLVLRNNNTGGLELAAGVEPRL